MHKATNSTRRASNAGPYGACGARTSVFFVQKRPDKSKYVEKETLKIIFNKESTTFDLQSARLFGKITTERT